MARRTIAPVVAKFVQAVRAQGISVHRVILYGSQASGRQRPESDIDVAIVSRDFGKDQVEERMRLLRIAGSIDSRIEPIALSKRSFEQDTWIPIIHEIREHGVALRF